MVSKRTIAVIKLFFCELLSGLLPVVYDLG
jgi:hypothetical protein